MSDDGGQGRNIPFRPRDGATVLDGIVYLKNHIITVDGEQLNNVAALITDGAGDEFLSDDGTYKPRPAPAGVESVTGSENINITGTAADPIVNLDDIIEGTGSGGALVMRGAANSPTGGIVNISGGGASNVGGAVSIFGGFGNVSGGDIFLSGGDGTSDLAGDATLKGGDGDEQVPGGDVFVRGGNAGFDGGKGGEIIITSGNAEGSGEDSGDITIDVGTSSGGGGAGFGRILLARNNGSVGIGTGTVEASSLLEMFSTTQGFLPPRMTTTQRDAISSPATGLEIYNTTTDQPEHFNGSAWASTSGAETLAQTLANGNTTGGNDIVITSGDNILGVDGTAGGSINITSGTGSSGNGGDLDLESGGGFGSGGAVNLTSGDGTFAGGAININSGAASSSNSPGGLISLQAGSSSGTSSGGQLHIFAGIGGDNSGTGGLLLVHAGGGGNDDGNGGLLSLEGGQGAASGNADGGDVDIQGGAEAGTGVHGNVLLQKDAGLVGIGNPNPLSKLDVESSTTGNLLRLSAKIGNSAAVLNINSERTTAGNVGIINFNHDDVAVSQILGIVTDEPNNFGDLRFSTKGGNGFLQRMVIDEDGRVGMGTNNPARALDVHRVDAVYIGISDNSQERFLIGYTEGESFNGSVEDNVFQTQILADTNGDLHIASRSNQASSIIFYTTEASTTTAEERMRLAGNGVVTIAGIIASRVAPQTIEVFTAADLDDIASGGVMTISSQTAIVLKANVTTSNRFDVSNAGRFTIGNGGQGYSLTYDGAATFITAVDSIVVIEAGLTATGGGTLFDVSGQIGTIINLDFVLLTGWKMGTIRRSPNAAIGPDVFLLHMSALNWQDTLTLENVSVLGVDEIALIPFAGAGVPYLEIKGDTPGSYTVNAVSGSLAAGESVVRIDPGIANDSLIFVAGSTIGGTLFDVSGGATGTFSSATDVSVALTTIDSVTDSSGVARFNFTVGPTLFVNQQVDIVNFVTETSYNQTGIITAVGAGFFEIDSIAFTSDDATGDFSSDSVEMVETSTALVDGDTLVLDTTVGTDYDGGATVYNQLTNSFRINRTFTISRNGTWDTAGIDQSDPRVLAAGNPGFVDSKYIACASVNDNSTATGTIVNDTFTDMVFGTGGGGLIESTTTERWKLINSIEGLFEYTGNEPFDGFISFDFTVVSSGGTVDFRFKWEKDTGSGFGDLEDNVEALVAVGSDSASVTKTFPLLANKGDKIRPQITRNSGTSGITSSYATIFATQ